MPLIINKLPKHEDKVIIMGQASKSVADYYPPGATEPIVRPASVPPAVEKESEPDPEPEQQPVEQVEEQPKEVEVLKPKRGHLPDDFPHVENLREAGITTYAKVKALKGDYDSIEGIGEARGQDIDAALSE